METPKVNDCQDYMHGGVSTIHKVELELSSVFRCLVLSCAYIKKKLGFESLYK